MIYLILYLYFGGVFSFYYLFTNLGEDSLGSFILSIAWPIFPIIRLLEIIIDRFRK